MIEFVKFSHWIGIGDVPLIKPSSHSPLELAYESELKPNPFLRIVSNLPSNVGPPKIFQDCIRPFHPISDLPKYFKLHVFGLGHEGECPHWYGWSKVLEVS